MLYFTRWKAAAIVLTALVVCLFAVPNFIPSRIVDSWPKWAQRHVVLGLDLQGGSHILLEVDTKAVRKEMLETLRDDARRVLREARIGYTGLVVRGNSVEVRIREGANSSMPWTSCRACRSRSAAFSAPLASAISTSPPRPII
jgi:preprotein translocase subunit SecD